MLQGSFLTHWTLHRTKQLQIGSLVKQNLVAWLVGALQAVPHQGIDLPAGDAEVDGLVRGHLLIRHVCADVRFSVGLEISGVGRCFPLAGWGAHGQPQPGATCCHRFRGWRRASRAIEADQLSQLNGWLMVGWWLMAG